MDCTYENLIKLKKCNSFKHYIAEDNFKRHHNFEDVKLKKCVLQSARHTVCMSDQLCITNFPCRDYGR